MKHIIMQVCLECFRKFAITSLPPLVTDTLDQWWTEGRERPEKKERRYFDSMVLLICWSTKEQRNYRVFGNEGRQRSVEGLATQIWEEWSLWKRAITGGSTVVSRL
jgi:hypothetical protein